MPALYLKDSQQFLADISDADLAAMMEALEEESSTDRDYFIDLDTVYLLKATGAVTSGGAGKALVAAGVVTVDGQTETRKTCKIRAGQRVETPELRIRVDAAPSA